MKYLFSILLLLISMQVFSQLPTTPGMHNLTMTHDSVLRKFLLVIPSTYNSGNNAPLMFCFHGGTQTIQSFVYNQMDTINGGGREELLNKAEAEGFILVFPEALVNSISGGTLWNDSLPKSLYIFFKC